MANNRMYLKNKRTGEQVLIAKYFPGSGWYVFHDDLGEKLDELFVRNEPAPTQWGDNDWIVEYEMDPRGN